MGPSHQSTQRNQKSTQHDGLVELEPELLLAHLQVIARPRHSTLEPLGLLLVRHYIHATLSAYGHEEEHPLKGASSSGKNLILKLSGKHPELAPVLVGAHYDRLIGAYQGKIRRG
jgi:hypothetical protein